MAKKRKRPQLWQLPATFKQAKKIKEAIQRHDGEPTFHDLRKFANDRTLSTNVFKECCGCGLLHHYTINVLSVKTGKKPPEWFVVMRAHRVPGTGPKPKKK